VRVVRNQRLPRTYRWIRVEITILFQSFLVILLNDGSSRLVEGRPIDYSVILDLWVVCRREVREVRLL
jgi:hypothetical protein